MSEQDLKYKVYWSDPMDYFEGYVHVSDISKTFETFIIQHPRSNYTFEKLWDIVLNKLYWAWTKSKNIDLKLRQSDFWIRIISDGSNIQEVILIFKSDNNGTVYAIIDNIWGHREFIEEHLFHEFGMDWYELDESDDMPS